MGKRVENLEELITSLSDEPPAIAAEYAVAVTGLIKDVRDLKALVIQDKPKQWHRDVKAAASLLEARAAVAYEEVDVVKASFKEAKRLNLQIENAMEAFEDLT